MFGRSDKEATTVSEYIEKKSKQIKKKKQMIRSKINYALHGQHKHYYSKQDVLANGENAHCKVCDMLLSEFRVQKRIDNWSPYLKPIRKTPQQPTEQERLEDILKDAI